MKRVKRYRLYYENQYTTEGGYVDLTLLSLIWNLLRGYYKDSYQVRYTIFKKIIILKK
jgi:hypothetical protein